MRRSLVLAGMAVLTVLGPAAAQDPSSEGVRLGITYQAGYQDALVVRPAGAGAGLEAVADQVTEILRRDLDYADRFDMRAWPDSLTGPINYALWNQLGAVWLVEGNVTGTPSAPILRVGLHDVVFGKLENVQAFSLPAPDDPDFRMAVHRAADAVVEWATETPGVAATRIAFVRRSQGGTSALYLVDSDGENLRRIAGGTGNVYSPAFSPDGRRVAYTTRDDEGSYTLLELDLRTGRTRTIAGPAQLLQSPSYLPDGRLAYASATGGGETHVFLEGSRISRTGRSALNPSFSPDGGRFAFEADPLGAPQIYVQSTSGGSARLISVFDPRERLSANGPDWSPTGDRIVYSAQHRGVYQIFAVNPDGTDRRMLTTRGWNEEPSWAPDGRHVVFAGRDESGHALWVVDTVTGRARRLVASAVDILPDWSGRLAR